LNDLVDFADLRDDGFPAIFEESRVPHFRD
jgi:hypothetical protein